MTKKIISVILAVCMVLSMAAVAGITASAAEGTTFIIAGEAALCTSNWKVDDVENQMTLNEGTGFYEKTYTDVAPGTYQFKVTQGDWDLENWGSPALDNYYLQVDEACDVTIAFDPVEEVIYATGSGVGVYEPNIEAIYACGNGEGDWMNGVDWAEDPFVADNQMEEVEDGVYKITFEGDIPEYDNYQIKFSTKDWANSWGGSKVEGVDNTLYVGDAMDLTYNGENIIFNAPCDLASVTFTFDISEFDFGTGKGAKASVEYVPDEDAEYYIVAGEAALCTDNWVADSFRNVMFYDGNADEFQKVYKDVPAGSYQFKVVKNSDWDQSWGNDAGANFDLVVNEACDVTVHFNYETGAISVTGDGIGEYVFEVNSVYLAGNGEPDNGWMNGVDWAKDPFGTDQNKMTQISEGVYQITFTDVAEFDNYLFKAAANGDWKINWGGAQGADNTVRPNGIPFALTPNGENIVFDCPTDIDSVTITVDISNYDNETGLGAFLTVTTDEEPTLDTTIKFGAATVAFANSLEVKFLVEESMMDKLMEGHTWVTVTRTDAEGNSDVRTLTDYAMIDYYGKTYAAFSYKGLNPQLVGDSLSAEIYGRGVDDGILYKGKTRNYSVLTYALNTLNNASSSDKTKTMIVDLLYYAAAAQSYAHYNEANLVTDNLTDAQKAYKTATPHEYQSIMAKDSFADRKLKFTQAAAVLGSSVSAKFYFTPVTDVNLDDVTVVVSIGNRNQAGVYTAKDFVKEANGDYSVTFDDTFASELSDKMTAIAYDKEGNQISDVLYYSIETYVARSKTTDPVTKNLFDSLMNYGYSVMDFANKTPVI